MNDLQPSMSDRLRPLRGVLAIAARWLGIAAQKTWIVLKRLPIASYSFGRALADGGYARTLTDLYVARHSTPAASRAELLADSPSAPVRPPPPAARLQDAPPDSALMLLGLLQKEGRLVDFLQEDITKYSDQEIGAAARVVHEGCRRVVDEHLSITPIREEAEGSSVTLQKGFDPASVRPTGNVVGEPPFTGALVHRGWRAVEVRLPKVASSRDVRILAAAEVEL
jgi:hypothetical protein